EAADWYVARNRPRFARRHVAALAHRHHAFDLVNEPHRYYAARDGDAPDRRLIVVDELPAAPEAGARFDGPLVTLATHFAEPALSTRWRARGVEVVELRGEHALPALLATRRFHYSTVE